MGCESFVRDAGWHERHLWSWGGTLPVMSWARVEDPAFTAGFGNRHPDQGRGRCRAADLPGLRRVRAGGDPMTSPLPESDLAQLATAQLNALAADLDRGGFLTCVLPEGGMLKLQVTNRAVPSCGETITVASDDNGAWWFL